MPCNLVEFHLQEGKNEKNETTISRPLTQIFIFRTCVEYIHHNVCICIPTKTYDEFVVAVDLHLFFFCMCLVSSSSLVRCQNISIFFSTI